jgi:two-component system LytT family response regulator
MHRISALIVDDEPLARERLRGLLAAEPTVEVVGECGTGPEAIAAIRGNAPDLVFLDMHLPGCDGLKVLAELPEDRRPAIVFATADDGFAVDAFDVAAVDYLLKPFDRERFRQALRRAEDHLQRQREPDAAPASPAARIERIVVKTDGRLVFLRAEEIIRVEAADNYAALHLVTGRLMVRETLAALEVRLGPAFARVNRSALVHLDQVKEILLTPHGDSTVVLRDGTKLPLSRNLRGQLEKFSGK